MNTKLTNDKKFKSINLTLKMVS